MIELSRHSHKEEEKDPRRIIVLEFIAATAVFVVMGVVLFMVFTYKPV